jgi:hypothetical protein
LTGEDTPLIPLDDETRAAIHEGDVPADVEISGAALLALSR